jgi:hypothetical protein
VTDAERCAEREKRVRLHMEAGNVLDSATILRQLTG